VFSFCINTVYIIDKTCLMKAATNIKTFIALNTSYGNKTINKGGITWSKIRN